jgi:hypothetical protein
MLIGATWISSRSKVKPQAVQSNRDDIKPVLAVTKSSLDRQLASSPVKGSRPAFNNSDVTGLSNMVQMVSQFTQAPNRLEELLRYLKNSGQDPMLTRDNNPYTGDMMIVRTNNPFPGTRYFHAQYFQNASGEPFVQHMSFEYKPGSTALADAVTAIKNTFPNLSDPTVQSADYVQWKLDDDYILWIKKLGPEDLKDDPFNAYAPQDVGTVRVAVELEIHGSENE